MEDENEVLDWGNEDDEQQVAERTRRGSLSFHDIDRDAATAGGTNDVDDAEDAVSLGGDDEDSQEYASLHRQELSSTSGNLVASSGTNVGARSVSVDGSHRQQELHSPSGRSSPSLHQRKGSESSQKATPSATNDNSAATTQSPQRAFVHALPPKPIAATVPFLHPSHPSIIEATAMSRGREKSKPNGNSPSKPLSSADSISITGDPPLPPDWEIRFPRSGGGNKPYFYNVRTHESTWTRPRSTSTSTVDKRTGKSNGSTTDPGRGGRPSVSSRDDSTAGRRSPPPVRLLDSYRPGLPSPPRSSRASDLPSTGPLSYEDRHYRPGEDAPSDTLDTNSRSIASSIRDMPPRHASRRSRSRSLSPRPPQDRSRDSNARPSRSQRSTRKTDVRDDSPGRHWVAPGTPPLVEREHEEPSSHNDRHGTADELDSLPRDRRSNQARDVEHTVSPAQEQTQQHVYNDSHNAAPVSSSRHRSPPPQFRERDYERERDTLPDRSNMPPPSHAQTPSTSAAQQPVSTQTQKTRERPSRFDQPAPSQPIPLQTRRDPTPPRQLQPQPTTYTDAPRGRDCDPCIPPDIVDVGSSRRVERAPPLERPDRTDRRNRDEAISSYRSYDAHIDRPPQTQMQHLRDERDFDLPPPSHRERERDRDVPATMAIDSPGGTATPPSEVHPRRNRAPLPPQNAQFRDEVIRKKGPPVHEQLAPPIPGPATLPPTPKDYPGRAPPISGSAPPSGPRSQQSLPVKESIYAEPPPRRHPAPSSSVDRRMDQDRRIPSTDVSMHMDVDQYPRAPRGQLGRAPSNDVMMRAPLGSHAETSTSADVPRGPRAMVSPSIPQAPSPVIPHVAHSQAPASAWRSRERSPPHHLASRRDNADGYSAPHRLGSRPDSRYGEEHLGRRPNDLPPPPRGADAPAAVDPHPRREPRRGRRDAPLSGTNNVPIANKRSFAPGGVTPAKPLDQPMPERSSAFPDKMTDAPPLRTRSSYQGEDIRDREYPPSAHMEVGNPYRAIDDGRYGGSQRSAYNDRTQEPLRRSPEVGSHPPATQRSRYYDDRPPSVNDHPPSPEIYRTSSSRWATRNPTPPRNTVPAGSYGESEYRRATSPPPSREPSQSSMSWQPQGSQGQDRSRSRERDPPSGRARKSRFGGPVADAPAPVPSSWSAREEPLHRYRQDEYEEADARRNGSLQGRLDGRHPDEQRSERPARPEEPQPSPVLPSHPLRRDYGADPIPEYRSSRRESPPRERERDRDKTKGQRPPNEWPPSDQRVQELPPRPFPEANLPPRPPPPREEPRPRDSPVYDAPVPNDTRNPYSARPQAKRTGGSLLDRLSFDRGDPSAAVEDRGSPSLRDRVLVPTKRDRDEAAGFERNTYDRLADHEEPPDGDVVTKRRRRSGKPRRGRRGGGMQP